uniref:Integrase catalytic domain-containing protein n=1 Tax=Cannabis sativa TaxID=3483 RepID=A0A803NPK4_CANSA
MTETHNDSNEGAPGANQDPLAGLSLNQCQKIMAMLAQKFHTESTSSPNQPIVSNFSGKSDIIHKNKWIIDTGATHHVCPYIDLFTNICHKTILSNVTLPDGTKKRISCTGTIRISSEIVLVNVLYVPDFKYSIMSVSALMSSANCFFIFHDDTCTIQDNSKKKMIGKGERHGDLFFLKSDSFATVFAFSDSTISVDTLWHYRLGHPSCIKEFPLNKELNFSQPISPNFHCSTCHYAKQKKLPFLSNHNMAKTCFELIHIDIWGPYHTITHDGFKYFLTIVDDCSRYTWIHLLKHKSEAKSVIPAFIKLVQTQYNATIKGFRSDNAKELQFVDLFRSLGIVHYHACVQRPQQNSVVERKHQHLLNVSRALLFQSYIPLIYWGECVSTTTYLINRIPTPNLGNKSPYEVLNHKAPTYNHLKPFGCLAYASTLSQNWSKFSPRVVSCIFLGYPMGMKAYKLLNLETNTIFCSRDVQFQEYIFPFVTNEGLPAHYENFFHTVPTIVDTAGSSQDMSFSAPEPDPPPSTPAPQVCEPAADLHQHSNIQPAVTEPTSAPDAETISPSVSAPFSSSSRPIRQIKRPLTSKIIIAS